MNKSCCIAKCDLSHCPAEEKRLTTVFALPIVALGGKKWEEMGITPALSHVSRCKQGNPGCQGPDGDADPLSRSHPGAQPGSLGRHCRPRPVPAAVPIAGLGGNRAQVDAPANPPSTSTPPATTHGGPRH